VRNFLTKNPICGKMRALPGLNKFPKVSYSIKICIEIRLAPGVIHIWLFQSFYRILNLDNK
jgi:hypothetical protein